MRPGRFVKYLPEHGWETRVLTVDRFRTRAATMELPGIEHAITRVWFPDIVGLGIRAMRRGGIVPGVTSARTSTADTVSPGLTDRWRQRLQQSIRELLPFNVLRLPDRALPWFVPAVAAGLRELSKQPYDAIFTTSGPPTSNLVGATLARISGLPWVADFRDLWTGNHAMQRAQPWQGLEETFERRVLSGASALITVSPELAHSLHAMHQLPTHVVTNGFDDVPAQDSRPVEAHGGRRRKAPGQPDQPPRLDLLYVGTIYPGLQDPSPLLAALADLKDRGRVSPDGLAVSFLGSDSGYLNPLIERYGLRALVRCEPQVPQSEAVRRQLKASALVTINWSDPAFQGIYGLKIFEYLNARRPILSIGPAQGVVTELLRATRTGDTLQTPSEIASQLERWLDELQTRGELTYEGVSEEIDRFHYRNLAGQVARILDSVS